MKKALSLESSLIELKALLDAKFEIMMKDDADLRGYEHTPNRSFTAYNFDKSIKIERRFSKPTEFNDKLLKEAAKIFQKYIQSENPPEIISKLINDAFSNQKGSIDKNKITKLLSYKEETMQNEMFSKALDILEQSKQIGETKVYYTLSVGTGEEKSTVTLNLNSL